MRLLLLVSSVVAGLVVATACTRPCRCFVGVLPLDGSTAVAADTPLMISGSLDAELLALGGAVALEGPAGPVAVDVLTDGSGTTLWPHEPLADGEYELRAYYREDANDAVHGHSTGDTPHATRSRFTVGTSSPEVLALFDDGGLYLLFSEPIDAGTLTDRVLLDAWPAMVTAVDDTLFRVSPSERLLAEGRPRNAEVTLLDGVLAASGQPLPATDGLTLDSWWTLDRAAGGAWCDCP